MCDYKVIEAAPCPRSNCNWCKGRLGVKAFYSIDVVSSLRFGELRPRDMLVGSSIL